MEGSLWLAILLASLFSSVLDHGAIYWICLPLVALCATMWALHWYYLRRSAFHVSWPVRILIAALLIVYIVAGAFWPGWMSPLPDASQWMNIILCLAAFVITSGAFTEKQISRLLAFLAFAGVVQVIIGLRLLGPGADGVPFFGPLASNGAVTGTIGSEWGLGIFLISCILAAATFAARALSAALPSDDIVFHSRVARLTSADANIALIALLTVCLMLILLFLVESILIFPLCMASIILFVLILALKGKAGPLMAACIIVVCLLLGLANLSRPSATRWESSGIVLQSNVRNLVSLEDKRAVNPAAMPVADESDDDSIRDDASDRPSSPRKTPWPVTLLFVGLIASLLVTALRGIAALHENQPILAAGAFSTVIALALSVPLGARLSSLGVTLTLSVICAVAAVGGDFEEELEEEQ